MEEAGREIGFFEAVHQRHSIREYLPRPVEDETLQVILEAANAAPSAGNLQAYEIVAVRNAETRNGLAAAALGQEFVAEVPVVLVFLQNAGRSEVKYGRRGVELYSVQDATIACAYAQLAVTALGLASCWVGAFRPDPVSRAVNAPSELTPAAMLPLGYAAEEPSSKGRRSLTDLVKW